MPEDDCAPCGRTWVNPSGGADACLCNHLLLDMHQQSRDDEWGMGSQAPTDLLAIHAATSPQAVCPSVSRRRVCSVDLSHTRFQSRLYSHTHRPGRGGSAGASALKQRRHAQRQAAPEGYTRRGASRLRLRQASTATFKIEPKLERTGIRVDSVGAKEWPEHWRTGAKAVGDMVARGMRRTRGGVTQEMGMRISMDGMDARNDRVQWVRQGTVAVLKVHCGGLYGSISLALLLLALNSVPCVPGISCPQL